MLILLLDRRYMTSIQPADRLLQKVVLNYTDDWLLSG